LGVFIVPNNAAKESLQMSQTSAIFILRFQLYLTLFLAETRSSWLRYSRTTHRRSLVQYFQLSALSWGPKLCWQWFSMSVTRLTGRWLINFCQGIHAVKRSLL